MRRVVTSRTNVHGTRTVTVHSRRTAVHRVRTAPQTPNPTHTTPQPQTVAETHDGRRRGARGTDTPGKEKPRRTRQRGRKRNAGGKTGKGTDHTTRHPKLVKTGKNGNGINPQTVTPQGFDSRKRTKSIEGLKCAISPVK